MNQTDIAYIAGIFDGEGSVYYFKRWTKSKGRPKPSQGWYICYTMSLTTKYVLEWMKEILGFGTIISIKVPEGRKPQWRWQCSHRDAYKFAKLIWPHVQIKLHKTEQILDHYDDMDPLKKHHHKKETKIQSTAKIIYLNERKKTNVLSTIT